MKKILFTFLFLMFFVTDSVAEIIHVVARGESIESIADKYGIEVKDIENANSGIRDLFYIGQRVNIPIDEVSAGPGRNRNNYSISFEEQHLSDEAALYFKYEKWGKSVKYYNKLIKKYPRAVYYYNRGLAHFNNNKNRQAANDLRKAIMMDDCSETMRDNGWEIISEAEKRHSAWSNRIGGIVLGAAAMGLATWAVVETAKTEEPSNSYTASSNSNGLSNIDVLGQNGDMNAVFNQIMAKSIEEVQMEEQAEYNQARIAWRQMTGEDLSYDQWCLQKGQALLETQAQNGNNTQDGSDYWSEENRKKRQEENFDTMTGGLCGLCKGKGTCHACGGTKIVQSKGQTYVCTLCNDDGDCPHCHGTGKAWYKN